MTKNQEPAAVPPATRQKAYHERRREAGMVRVSTWIPEAKRDEFAKAVARLQKKWTSAGEMV